MTEPTPSTDNNVDNANETYDPDAIIQIANAEKLNPFRLIEELKQNPELRELFEADAGVEEGFSIEQHTATVLNQYEKYFAESQRASGTMPRYMRLLLAMHDIGKPLGGYDKNKQHSETDRIASKHLARIGFTPEQIKALCGLIKGDPIGAYLRGRTKVGQAASEIIKMAQEAGLSPIMFFDFLKIYFSCDCSSYRSELGGSGAVDYLFDPDQSELKFVPEIAQKFDDLRAEIFKIQIKANEKSSR